jgi:hypothetical protein
VSETPDGGGRVAGIFETALCRLTSVSRFSIDYRNKQATARTRGGGAPRTQEESRRFGTIDGAFACIGRV